MSISATLILFYGIGGFSNLFEVPAGAFADRYGRRLSYLIGVVCMCVGLGLWLFHLPIIVYAIARLVYCIGDALRSGTIDAMAFEEFHRHNEKEKYLNYVSHSRSFFYGVRLSPCRWVRICLRSNPFSQSLLRSLVSSYPVLRHFSSPTTTSCRMNTAHGL